MADSIKPDLESPVTSATAQQAPVSPSAETIKSQFSSVESAPKSKKKNHFLPVLGIIFSLVLLFSLANFVIPRFLVYLTKATRVGQYSLNNSYVFASPITARADGEEKIQVNVFLLDSEGHGVADKQISLTLTPKGSYAGIPQVNPLQPVTNKYGQAIFEITSTQEGFFEIIADVGGAQIPQTVSVSFR